MPDHITGRAFLVIICNETTNAIEHVVIWSSPEWEQSRCLHKPTYVAYATEDRDFEAAITEMLKGISDPRSRYYPLYQRLEERFAKKHLDAALAQSTNTKGES